MGRLFRTLADRPLAQATAIAIAGALAGLVANGLRAGGLPLTQPIHAASGATVGASCEAPTGRVQDVTVEEACALEAAGAAFVDARPASAFAAGHIAGALHLPSVGDCPGFDEAMARIREASSVVVYDADGSCALARRLADRLAAAGLPDVRVMIGGFPGWCAADRPAEAGACLACDHVAGKDR